MTEVEMDSLAVIEMRRSGGNKFAAQEGLCANCRNLWGRKRPNNSFVAGVDQNHFGID